MKPENGKMDQGILGRQGFDNAEVASGSMCTNPVAKITPAAKDLVAKKKLESDLRIRHFSPNNGSATPIIPAKRMEAMATNLRKKAAFSSRHASKTGESLQLLVDIGPKSKIVSSFHALKRKLAKKQSEVIKKQTLETWIEEI